MESRALTTIDGSFLRVDTLKNQVTAIQDAMRAVMKPGTHYGVIPGTEKLCLLKPGSDKLGLMFRLIPTYEIERTDLPGGHREYFVQCRLECGGVLAGNGIGCCSTMEKKYRFRKGERTCPSCGKSKTVIKGKAQYGGGWLCWNQKGGCGAKFADGDPDIEGQNVGQVENDCIADTYNTALKMAKKRAHADAILTATAASDIFDPADIEPEDDADEGSTGHASGAPQEEKKIVRALKQTSLEDDELPEVGDEFVDKETGEVLPSRVQEGQFVYDLRKGVDAKERTKLTKIARGNGAQVSLDGDLSGCLVSPVKIEELAKFEIKTTTGGFHE